MSKTIEELEKELHNARSSLSYYRNKGKPKHKKKPARSANKVQYGKNWNDTKRAMSVVIARLTATTEEEFKQVREQADALSVMEARELTKGYAEEVAAEVKARQEKRKARATAKEEEPEAGEAKGEEGEPARAASPGGEAREEGEARGRGEEEEKGAAREGEKARETARGEHERERS